MLVKVHGDYAGKASPAACLMDVVRRLVVMESLEKHEELLIHLVDHGIKVARQKSTMPRTASSWFTFADMLQDNEGWSAANLACRAANSLDVFEVEAAEEIFNDPSVRNKSIGMVIEL